MVSFINSVLSAGIFAVLLAAPAVFAEHAAPGQRRGRGIRGNGGRGGFLGGGRASLRDELHMAIASALGSGHSAYTRGGGRLAELRKKIEPMWRALAKNEHDRVDRRSLRYAVHRVLLQTRGLSIQGLEPVTAAQPGAAATANDLFTSHAPAHVRTLLEGADAEEGFSMEDAVATIAMMEELVVQQTRAPLERSFADSAFNAKGLVTREELQHMTEQYLLHWMLGNDTETIQSVQGDYAALNEAFENWDELSNFTSGVMKTFMFDRQKHQLPGASSAETHSWGPLDSGFSVDDAQAIVGEIALSFGSFWHLECVRVKETLARMDHGGIGRVKLQAFHNAALEGEWRFSESKEYLRQIGALDESSPTLGPRIIIPNYMQGPSNCIISDAHYRVCCINSCEAYLSEIEEAVKAPAGTPEQLLDVVGNITMNLDDDQPALTDSLRSQLFDISKLHAGKVPLHGRLFSQWLHYVFPQECQYPHKSGSVVSLSPVEYGDDYMASEDEMAKHAQSSQGNATDIAHTEDWMTQWSEEEELLADQLALQAPWELGHGFRFSSLILLLLGCAVALRAFVFTTGAPSFRSQASRLGKGGVLPSFTKAHLV
eukprot:TRINITY_DN1266_c0_g1_i1.p1 TRINITY_DN1266_c0_g1~~TRINITY_DN1266_c0_g1_i1.p1  ORF type:complete len:600 (+),score=173.42 TRINITY_DN1266_c0_g1_i1:125-1924(+)